MVLRAWLLILFVAVAYAPAALSSARRSKRELQDGPPTSCGGEGDDAPCSAGKSCQCYLSQGRRRRALERITRGGGMGRRLFGAPSGSSQPGCNGQWICMYPLCSEDEKNNYLGTMSTDYAGTNCGVYVGSAVSGSSEPDMSTLCNCIATSTDPLPNCRPNSGDLAFSDLSTTCTALGFAAGR